MQTIESGAAVPTLRRRAINDASANPDGDFVLYWMIAARRTRYNFAFDRAVELAESLGKPVVVLEALRVGYPWASDRFHRYVMDGMVDNATRLAEGPVHYYPYVEPEAGAGSGLLEALAACACTVVTDDFPCFFLPRMVAAAGARLPVALEAVDGNGLLPIRTTDRVFKRAVDFRRYLQKTLAEHLLDGPQPDPLTGMEIPSAAAASLAAIQAQWPVADLEALRAPGGLDSLPIDHRVSASEEPGGSVAAGKALDAFVRARLGGYADERNNVAERVTSELSGYLHFGHISSHDIFARIAACEDWNPSRLASRANGARAGWWGMSPAAEGYLDQLVTWRELGYNMTTHQADYASYDALPEWAQITLGEHAADPRPDVYDLDTFERAATHDPLWNAAQRELVRTGRIHNYLRMLWGKKILHWTATPQDALATMIELNNKYAIDGRNPNSYSGIFWCLGRYDRAWGPERPIFGKIRYMSSDSTKRKLDAKTYMLTFGPNERLPGL